MTPRPLINAMTVDLEDWYQGLEIPSSRWRRYEDRVAPATHRLLRLLDDASVRATFFILGDVADRHPELVAEIADTGHEIATHGQSHAFVYDQTPSAFQAEIERCVGTLEDLTGQRVVGHRAPFFSITRDSLWALDVLASLGILYDSSVFPVSNYRYGIPDAPRWPYQVDSDRGRITEFPISTTRIWGRNLPAAGGAYFRIYPYALTRHTLKAINSGGRPAVFYLHPWEVDPSQPRIDLPRRISATHYFNLRATERRLRRLLRDFRFAPMKEVLGVG
jgi:polysaccharide deacetylase family protein (PEP-CTERM system associated)